VKLMMRLEGEELDEQFGLASSEVALLDRPAVDREAERAEQVNL
jgi:hypothetical protein